MGGEWKPKHCYWLKGHILQRKPHPAYTCGRWSPSKVPSYLAARVVLGIWGHGEHQGQRCALVISGWRSRPPHPFPGRHRVDWRLSWCLPPGVPWTRSPPGDLGRGCVPEKPRQTRWHPGPRGRGSWGFTSIVFLVQQQEQAGPRVLPQYTACLSYHCLDRAVWKLVVHRETQ